MIRLVLFLARVLVIVAGLHWLADRPGNITVEWQGYVAETSVFRALIILAFAMAAALAAWSLLRQVWRTPAAMGRYFYRRRQQRGLDALTSGIIAVGAGDRSLALRYASQARKALPHEPLTHLLRAQAAQIGGDRATARRIFEAMLASPDTEQLGLRGLFLEAEREGEHEAARQFAERALAEERQARLGGGGPVRSQLPRPGLAGGAGHAGDRAPPAADRAAARQSPARRAAHRARAGSRGRRRRQGAAPGAGGAQAGARPGARGRRSPDASSLRAATRRGPPACCSRPGGSPRTPISPPLMPMPAPATARATAWRVRVTWRG